MDARPLKIAITVDPDLPVPPRYYGGIERMVDMLARGLVERGHEVVLFAHAQSRTAGRLFPYKGASSTSLADTFQNTMTIARHCFAGGFDILHSSSRIAYLLPLLPLSLPKLMTYNRHITRRSVELGMKLSRGSLEFSAVGRHMLKGLDGLGTWHVVPNGVLLSSYTFRPHVPGDAPMVFLGRIEPIKGTHIAIELARRTGVPLVIAGNVPEEHKSYFEERIRPAIDGHLITYMGPVDDRQKNILLGSARAFLMPVEWDEPFGIVMAEALACGTPVIGLDRGAIPEVVEHGVNGFVCRDLQQMMDALGAIGGISRAACRARVERDYSDAAVVESYLSVYRQMIARAS